MITTCMLAILLAPAQAESASAGSISCALGKVKVVRAMESLRTESGMSLQSDDVLATNGDGAASIVLPPGISAYLGSNTRVSMVRKAGGWSFELSAGEFRVVAGDAQSVTVWTKSAEATVARGILRTSVSPAGSRFWTESGAAQIKVAAPEKTERLQSGQELSVSTTGDVQGPKAATAKDWTLRLADLFRCAATDASRSQRGRQTESAQAESATRGAAAPAEPAPAEPPASNGSSTQTAGNANISLALGNVSASASSGAAGGLFSDAQQDTLSGMLTVPFQDSNTMLNAGDPIPGNIHLVTSQTRYALGDVRLKGSDAFPSTPTYWSIGAGAPPTNQVTTGFFTGTDATPTTLHIPHTGHYLIRLDQFGIDDPVEGTTNVIGITGLLGQTPTAPNVQGATPLVDNRARINPNATFALGEFRLERDGVNPVIAIRRSDQDRRIVKDPGGNDDLDQVTTNPDVTEFNLVPDPHFFPAVPAVYVPDSGQNLLRNRPSFGGLNGRDANDRIRKAAFTTLMADQLFDYSRRTGQTRFVVDGRIVDITGYRRR